ncbi:MAG: adenylate/guanylate cyclase domain-containing protein [Thaumarchaeota archaeon]|nr:adenylate/guanylate cyclase domain-containing protein [Nitrososphaerota archaeon]
MESCIKKCQKRITHSLDKDFEYHHLAITRSNKFLRKHDSEKMKMFVLFVDLGGSTKMSSELSPDDLAKIIRLFSQEMAYIIEYYNGFVLKYVGDAVIGYFPEKQVSTDVKNAVFCAQAMMLVIENAINPILQKAGYPCLQIKITIDFGNNNIVRYGSNKQKSHIDIIGLSVNLAAKMQSLGKPNQLVIGRQVFLKLPHRIKTGFRRIKASSKVWSYHDFTSKRPYPVFWINLS